MAFESSLQKRVKGFAGMGTKWIALSAALDTQTGLLSFTDGNKKAKGSVNVKTGKLSLVTPQSDPKYGMPFGFKITGIKEELCLAAENQAKLDDWTQQLELAGCSTPASLAAAAAVASAPASSQSELAMPSSPSSSSSSSSSELAPPPTKSASKSTSAAGAGGGGGSVSDVQIKLLRLAGPCVKLGRRIKFKECLDKLSSKDALEEELVASIEFLHSHQDVVLTEINALDLCNAKQQSWVHLASSLRQVEELSAAAATAATTAAAKRSACFDAVLLIDGKKAKSFVFDISDSIEDVVSKLKGAFDPKTQASALASALFRALQSAVVLMSKELVAAEDLMLHFEQQEEDVAIAAAASTNSSENDWAQEKKDLLRAHNAEKASILNEVRNLKKALNPATEKQFDEIRRLDHLREKLENDLVEAEIKIDQLKAELEEARRIHADNQGEYEFQLADLRYQMLEMNNTTSDNNNRSSTRRSIVMGSLPSNPMAQVVAPAQGPSLNVTVDLTSLASNKGPKRVTLETSVEEDGGSSSNYNKTVTGGGERSSRRFSFKAPGKEKIDSPTDSTLGGNGGGRRESIKQQQEKQTSPSTIAVINAIPLGAGGDMLSSDGSPTRRASASGWSLAKFEASTVLLGADEKPRNGGDSASPASIGALLGKSQELALKEDADEYMLQSHTNLLIQSPLSMTQKHHAETGNFHANRRASAALRPTQITNNQFHAGTGHPHSMHNPGTTRSKLEADHEHQTSSRTHLKAGEVRDEHPLRTVLRAHANATPGTKKGHFLIISPPKVFAARTAKEIYARSTSPLRTTSTTSTSPSQELITAASIMLNTDTDPLAASFNGSTSIRAASPERATSPTHLQDTKSAEARRHLSQTKPLGMSRVLTFKQ